MDMKPGDSLVFHYSGASFIISLSFVFMFLKAVAVGTAGDACRRLDGCLQLAGWGVVGSRRCAAELLPARRLRRAHACLPAPRPRPRAAHPLRAQATAASSATPRARSWTA